MMISQMMMMMNKVFDVIARFVELGNNKDLWIKTVESVPLDVLK